VIERISALSHRLEAEPKSRRWLRRARSGTRKRWYEQVDET
jgi:hypothetical protein